MIIGTVAVAAPRFAFSPTSAVGTATASATAVAVAAPAGQGSGIVAGTSAASAVGARVRQGAGSVAGVGTAAAVSPIYATWNPSDKAANITLSNGNLTATKASSGTDSARATVSHTTGLWYWEVVIDTVGANTHYVGVADGVNSTAFSMQLGQDAHTIGLSEGGLIFYNGGTTSSGIGTFTSGDRIGIRLDLTGHTIQFRKNGGTFSSAYTIPVALQGVAIFPALTMYWNGSQQTANFGASSFVDALPSGATAWNG